MNDRSVNPPAANRLVDEAALIEGLKSGDDAAAETFVREHAARMHAVARRLLGNDDDAADAVQDAFISAFRAIGDFEGGSKLSTWLHRITVNAALMKLRKSQRRGEVSIESLLPAYHDDGHRASNEGGWNTPPEQALEQSELQQVVRRQIHQLPEDYRNVCCVTSNSLTRTRRRRSCKLNRAS